DFVVTTDVEASQRGGTGAPRSNYSLAGIMVRAPRAITPSTWRAGGENYVFLSIGAGSPPGAFQFEVKTTTNSSSMLILAPAAFDYFRFARPNVAPSLIGADFMIVPDAQLLAFLGANAAAPPVLKPTRHRAARP